MDEIDDTCDFNDMEEINNSHHISVEEAWPFD
jgi:hypothetical protein